MTLSTTFLKTITIGILCCQYFTFHKIQEKNAPLAIIKRVQVEAFHGISPGLILIKNYTVEAKFATYAKGWVDQSR